MGGLKSEVQPTPDNDLIALESEVQPTPDSDLIALESEVQPKLDDNLIILDSRGKLDHDDEIIMLQSLGEPDEDEQITLSSEQEPPQDDESMKQDDWNLSSSRKLLDLKSSLNSMQDFKSYLWSVMDQNKVKKKKELQSQQNRKLLSANKLTKKEAKKEAFKLYLWSQMKSEIPPKKESFVEKKKSPNPLKKCF